MSAEARARISKATKARWAKFPGAEGEEYEGLKEVF